MEELFQLYPPNSAQFEENPYIIYLEQQLHFLQEKQESQITLSSFSFFQPYASILSKVPKHNIRSLVIQVQFFLLLDTRNDFQEEKKRRKDWDYFLKHVLLKFSIFDESYQVKSTCATTCNQIIQILQQPLHNCFSLIDSNLFYCIWLGLASDPFEEVRQIILHPNFDSKIDFEVASLRSIFTHLLQQVEHQSSTQLFEEQIFCFQIRAIQTLCQKTTHHFFLHQFQHYFVSEFFETNVLPVFVSVCTISPHIGQSKSQHSSAWNELLKIFSILKENYGFSLLLQYSSLPFQQCLQYAQFWKRIWHYLQTNHKQSNNEAIDVELCTSFATTIFQLCKAPDDDTLHFVSKETSLSIVSQLLFITKTVILMIQQSERSSEVLCEKLYLLSCMYAEEYEFSSNETSLNAIDLFEQLKQLQSLSKYIKNIITAVHPCIILKQAKSYELEKWRYNPWAKHALHFALQHITINSISGKLFHEITLPMVCKLADDYNLETKKLGLECLMRIYEVIPVADLRMHSQILFPIAKRASNFRDEPVIAQCFEFINKTIQRLIPAVEIPTRNEVVELMDSIIQALNYSNSVEQRVVILRQLNVLLQSMKIGAVKHLKKLLFALFFEPFYYELKIEEEYKQNESFKEIVEILNSLYATCWIRMQWHREELKKQLAINPTWKRFVEHPSLFEEKISNYNSWIILLQNLQASTAV